MQFSLPQAIQILSSTPATLRALLGHLDAAWTDGTYGKDTFSTFDIVGHLISGEESDWIPRVRHILAHGEQAPFTPYDRYAQFEASRGKSMGVLLDEFAARRSESLTALQAFQLSPADLARRGRHPALGSVTIAQLLSTWTVHDLNHLAQISRALAAQYEDQVGPWHAYLGIFRSPATPMDAEGVARRAAARATHTPRS